MPTIPSPPLVIAHRGASHDAPENTLAAFRLAWEQGADRIETDCRLTKEGEVVCIHDPTTQRTANQNLKVADSLLSELRQLDLGSWKDPRFAGQRLPTLAEVLTTVPKGKQIFIEVKVGTEIVPTLKKRIGAANLDPSQIVILGFSPEVITACKRAMPSTKAYLLTDYSRPKTNPGGAFQPTAAELIETLRACRTNGLGTEANREVLTPAFLQTLRDGGLKEFFVWTVDNPGAGRHFRDLGANAIATNRPKEMREWLSRKDSVQGRKTPHPTPLPTPRGEGNRASNRFHQTVGGFAASVEVPSPPHRGRRAG